MNVQVRTGDRIMEPHRLYAEARARGKRNPHATRIVARAWLRVIRACWHNGTPYDPEAHQAAQRHTA